MEASTQVHKCTPSRNTKKRARNYVFTLNNPTEEDRQILREIIETECNEYAMQDERGENDTLHIQGYLNFKNAKTFNAVKQILPRAHIEVAKNIFAARNYCSKNDTYVGNRQVSKKVNNISLNVATKDPLNDVVPHDWQTQVLNIISKEPNDREIIWIYDEHGNSGKTTLCKSICMNYDNAIYLSGKISDMQYGIYNMIEQHKKAPGIVFIDIPRSLDCQYVSYAGIEAIKNGIFYNTKYKSGMVLFDSPHVIIFSNHPPLMDKFSEDRYNIITL